MSGIRFECVRPIEEDARLIMEWRNDPVTLEMSYHKEPKVWDDFYDEFIRDYFLHPTLPPLFILQNDTRVGFLLFREIFHKERVVCDISINISPKFRGKGIGTAALKSVKGLLEKRGIDDVIAEVKIENETSKKIFESAGFKYVESTKDVVKVNRYLLSLTPEKKQESVFIIAEAGSNWAMENEKESLLMAKKMISLAAESGADAIKFQTFRSKDLYVENAGASGYLSESGFENDIHEILKKCEMPYKMIPLLAEFCEKQGIEFMSSVFSYQDFKAVDPYVKRHKLASYEISHTHLINLMAASGKPLIMSTGCANLDEIAWAVQLYRKRGGKDLTLMQCTAKYPAPLETLNLHAIRSLKNHFHVSVGLSDHSINPVIGPVAAVALGATVIEKHMTVDKTLKGPDHAFALDPNELKLMIKMIRQTEKALGTGVKSVLPEEQELFEYARRWLQATKDVAEGEVLQENDNFAILRPGNQKPGAHPMHASQIEGKRAIKNIALGEGINFQDVK